MAETKQQLLHLVFGGKLKNLKTHQFADLSKLDVVGVYPNYKTAHEAWSRAARATIDDAHMRYFIVHIHRLLDPTTGATRGNPKTAKKKQRG